MCMHVWVCIYNVYTRINVCMWVYTCVCVCARKCGVTCVSMLCVCVNSPPSLCMVACYSDYRLVRAIRTQYREIRIVLVVDLIHW